MVNGAVASFEVAAISQSERPGVSVGEQSFEWRPRPLSAAANYYLAARTVAAVPFTGGSVGVERFRTNAAQMLQSSVEEVGGAGVARLRAVAARWEGALDEEVELLAS